ncbi:class I SAM-dependent methyltransferase [Crocinitomix catalasitica]|nr:class I SAM-dependent methyltransferase [Crocinitomix catalasitica]
MSKNDFIESKSINKLLLSKDELKSIIRWDVKNWKRALRFWNKHCEIKVGMRVLALGERDGGLSYYFAKLGCDVVCSDYKDFPDSTAEFHEAGKADMQISYKKIDMRSIDFGDDQFDIVVFKSVIGALGKKEDQVRAIQEIHRVLRDGGCLLFAENAVGSALHSSLRKKFVTWNDRWRYIGHDDVRGWAQLFSLSYSTSFGMLGLLGRSENQRNFFGALDRIISPLCPRRWRYIIFVVMIK